MVFRAPRRIPGGRKAIVYAVLLHVALVVLIVVGVRWQARPQVPAPVIQARVVNDVEAKKELERRREQELVEAKKQREQQERDKKAADDKRHQEQVRLAEQKRKDDGRRKAEAEKKRKEQEKRENEARQKKETEERRKAAESSLQEQLAPTEVPPNAQGELQGALTSLMSLAAIVGPLIMTNTFAWFTGPRAPVYFPGAALVLSASLTLLSTLFARKSLKRNAAGSVGPA